MQPLWRGLGEDKCWLPEKKVLGVGRWYGCDSSVGVFFFIVRCSLSSWKPLSCLHSALSVHPFSSKSPEGKVSETSMMLDSSWILQIVSELLRLLHQCGPLRWGIHDAEYFVSGLPVFLCLEILRRHYIIWLLCIFSWNYIICQMFQCCVYVCSLCYNYIACG